MMKNKLTRLALVSGLFLCTNVLADSSGYHHLDRVEVGENSFSLYVKTGNFNSASCDDGSSSNINNVVTFSRVDFPNSYNNLLATSTTAYVTGKTISMWYKGCKDSPWGNGKMPNPATIVLK